MKNYVFSAALLAAFLPSIGQAADVTIYTYESFTADWGPGPQVEKAFETECGCDVEFVSAADGVALLNRLRLEDGNTDADVVLGLDQNLIAEAKQTGYFAPHGINTDSVVVPGGFENDVFVPFDYGYFAVIYDAEKVPNPPQSMKEFLNGSSDQKIAIQDPRTSTPGLGLMLWLKDLYGDNAAEAYAKLQERVLTVTPGWSEAYGLFTNGEVPMVFSYTTSPAYHMIAEGEDRYQAASFSEGHYMQIEVAGLTQKGKENAQATRFMEFMISPAFQDIIPETNWMLPAAGTSSAINPVFDQLVQPENALLISSDEIAANRRKWVDEWLEVLSR